MQTPPPLITVVVAVYNAAETLQRCIDSFEQQTYPNKELIVIDGASSDQSPEIVRANEAKLAYWESERDRGIYHAWNKAVARARGEWIAFLGADDVFADDQALASLAEATSAGLDFVWARVAVVAQDGRVRALSGSPWDWERMKRTQVVAHPAGLHRRGLFDEVGPFDERYRIAGDYDFLLRCGARVRAAFVDRVVVRFADGGLSSKQRRRLLAEKRLIHARHPEIGPLRAHLNHALTLGIYAKAGIKKVLGRVWRPRHDGINLG
ncbi:MAG TPA: glycosyltransferase family 2 protein [Pantanalinema sp.]